jgi:hypothetical protein
MSSAGVALILFAPEYFAVLFSLDTVSHSCCCKREKRSF